MIEWLFNRFERNMHRHVNVTWDEVNSRLLAHPQLLVALEAMETTGGEPDVVVLNPERHTWCFVDCSVESPVKRRSRCYDAEALAARKANKPEGSAIAEAEQMGVTLLTAQEYQSLQALQPFDLKTSSWVLTPSEIRSKGGALFGDRRYGAVFIYHNGAESYFAARGFRCKLTLPSFQ